MDQCCVVLGPTGEIGSCSPLQLVAEFVPEDDAHPRWDDVVGALSGISAPDGQSVISSTSFERMSRYLVCDSITAPVVSQRPPGIGDTQKHGPQYEPHYPMPAPHPSGCCQKPVSCVRCSIRSRLFNRIQEQRPDRDTPAAGTHVGVAVAASGGALPMLEDGGSKTRGTDRWSAPTVHAGGDRSPRGSPRRRRGGLSGSQTRAGAKAASR